jgi:hypothetical protein
LIGEEDGEESECNGCDDYAGCVAGVAIYLGCETGCGAVEQESASVSYIEKLLHGVVKSAGDPANENHDWWAA